MVVDDERPMRVMLAEHLAAAGYRAVAVGSGEEALAAFDRTTFSAVVLDVVLPGMSGIEVCRQLRASGTHVPVILVTACTAERDCVLGLEAGADDYVTKPFSVRELLARVHAHVRRDEWYSGGEKFSFGDVELRVRQRLVTRRGRRVPLSSREFELLRYLLAHRNEVVTREQLMRDVWGYSQLAVSRTVDNHIAKLRALFEPRPHAPRYIVTVHGSGYQLLA